MPPPLTQKRTRLSIKQKAQIIEDSKKVGFDKKKTMEDYGISRTGLIYLLKNQGEIMKAVDSCQINEKFKSIKRFLKVKIESSVQKQITDHFSQVPSMDTDEIMELCKSLEKSDLSEINLHNQEMCSSCDENHVGVFKCVECDDILCQRCYKAHGRLKVTKTHVVTPL